MKLSIVGSCGQNTGGQAVLSMSYLSDSEIIQKKTNRHGASSTATDNARAALSKAFWSLRLVRKLSAMVSSTSSVPLGLLARPQEHQRQRHDDGEEDHDDSRCGADLILGEGLRVEIDVHRLRRRARPAVADDPYGLEGLERVDGAHDQRHHEEGQHQRIGDL